MEEKQTLVVAFALIQSGLTSEGLLDPETGLPIKRKNPPLIVERTLWMYNWLIDKLKDVDDPTYMKYVEDYNQKVSKLSNEYRVDELVMGASMLERWLNEYGSGIDKNILKHKVVSLIKYCSEGIRIRYVDNAMDIIKDSIAAADNGFRILTGKPELTKEVRDARLQKWRNVTKNRPKDKENA